MKLTKEQAKNNLYFFLSDSILQSGFLYKHKIYESNNELYIRDM